MVRLIPIWQAKLLFIVMTWRGYLGLVVYNHDPSSTALENMLETKHIQRYIDEFVERQNTLMMQPIERFVYFVRLTVGKRLTY